MISRRVLQHAGTELNTLRATRLGSLAAHRSLLIGAGALALALGACSAGDEADGMPTYGNVPSFGSTGTQNSGTQNNNGAVQNPATSNNGSSTPSPTASNGSSNNGSQATPPAQQNGSQNNGSQPSGQQTGSAQEGNPNTAPISNGNNNNGSANNGSGNTGGSGGMMAPGAAGNTGMPPANNGNQNPPPANPPPANPPPTTPDITCPTGASFCSGFESAALPSGSVFQPTGMQPQFDTAVKHSGNQSIVFPAGSGGFSVKEVVTPIPGQTFWARMFVQVSSTFGDGDHDSLFVGSTATPTQDNNDEHGVEFSEQANQVLLNSDDNPLAGANGPGFPQAPGPMLSANTWHCIEAFFDGGTGDVQMFGDGNLLIDAPAFKRLTYSTFRFGYIQFNTARTIHFDDVVVAPNRINCN
jgi:hypothetical protein